MIRFRVLFVWLLMLALPLQGFAAASMLNCGPGMRAGAQAAQHQTHEADQHLAHAGHKPADHHHAASVSSPNDAGDGADSHPRTTAHKCLSCVFCGHAVAINECPEPLIFGDAAHASLPELSVLIPTLPVRVPDKPPRA